MEFLTDNSICIFVGNGPRSQRNHHLNGRIDRKKSESLQLDFESILSAEPIPKNDSKSEATINLNSNDVNQTLSAKVLPVGQQNITQKVKFIPSNQFVHIKPPPINTQKIYMKPQSGGNQSFTLNVNNIGSTHGSEILTNNMITAKSINASQQAANSQSNSPSKHTNKTITILKTVPTIEENADLETNTATVDNVNILDIPILYADNDGNVLENDQPNAEADKQIASNDTLQPIDILSAQIVDDSEVGHETTIESEPIVDAETKSEAESSSSNESPSTPPKPVNRGNFVVLNRDSLRQFKNVNLNVTTPTIKYKKVYVPSSSKSFMVTQSNNAPKAFSPLNGKTLMPGTKINISKLVRSPKQFKTGKFQNLLSIPSTSTSNQPVTILNGKRTTLSGGKQRNIVIRKGNFSSTTTSITKPHQTTTALNRNITVRKINFVRSLSNGIPGASSKTSTKLSMENRSSKDKGNTSDSQSAKMSPEDVEANNSLKQLIAELES